MSPDLSASRIYTDFNGLADLRLAARQDSEEALQEVASQFEAVFIQMMLKSMRDASLAEGIFDSQQSDMYLDMFDQQIALDLSMKGAFGIAEMMVRQLSNNEDKQLDEAMITAALRRATASGSASIDKSGLNESSTPAPSFNSPEEFIDFMLPRAQQAAATLGVSPQLLVAQAALETGWGQKIMRQESGESSYNLFGIKADERWSGAQLRVTTLEFRDGVMQQEQANFRRYDSFQQSFDDYVEFVQQGTRYQQALQHEGNARHYIQGLQEAGYATDPAYAEKVLNILDRDFG